MKNNLEIGSRIRSVRESMRLNRNSFSERINISEIFLSQIERGEKSLSLNTLISICVNTGCSADYLLFGKIDENSAAKKTIRLLNQLPPEVNSLVYDIAGSVKDIYNISSCKLDIKEEVNDKIS